MSSSEDFRLVDALTCSNIGRVGSGLIDDKAKDFLWGAGASAFGFFGPLSLLSAGCRSSGSSWTRFRPADCSSRRLIAVCFKASSQEARFLVASENRTYVSHIHKQTTTV